MTKISQESFLFLTLTCFLLGTGLFFVGFFPVAYETVEIISKNDDLSYERPVSLNGIRLVQPAKKYPQTILMVVDALRWNFLNKTNMPFTYENACMHFSIEVDIPTVTMPRLKSLTTGTLSTFIDIILNLGETEQLDDSLIHQLVKNGANISFVGDRTWTNLFPNKFYRQQANVDSFYVNDFYEGDKNVTQYLMKELTLYDWNMLILHYLGLDHIGHVEGSTSSRIFQKLNEMDKVVQKIYNGQNFHNQLVLITADHGMRNGGGHGGSTTEERFVPLSVFKKNCTAKNLINNVKYKQIDIVPTLAVLLSIDIPKHSVGCLILEMLQDLTYEDQLYALYYNTKQLLQLTKRRYGQQDTEYLSWFLKAKSAHFDFLSKLRNKKEQSSFDFEQAKLNYVRSSRTISTLLSESRVRFHYDFIAIGLTLTTMTTGYILIFALFTESNYELENFPKYKRLMLSLCVAIFIYLICYYKAIIKTSHILNAGFITLSMSIAIYFGINIVKMIFKIILPMHKSMQMALSIPIPLLACFIFHTCSLASSSFIEEEHQTWYYLGATALILLFMNKFRKATIESNIGQEYFLFKNIHKTIWKMRSDIKMLIVVTLMRKLNQTGDRWKDLIDLGDILNEHDNKAALTLFFIIGLVMLLMQLKNVNGPLEIVPCFFATMCIYCFRGASGTVNLVQSEDHNKYVILMLFWISIVILAIIPYAKIIFGKKTYGYARKPNLIKILNANFSCFLLVSALLHKPHNVILVPALVFVLQVTYSLCDNLHNQRFWRDNQLHVLAYKTVLTIFVAKMFYFYQGNSNSLATIDLNPGYIGQTSYNPIIVGTFVTLNTYCAYIVAFLYLILHTFSIQAKQMPRREEKEQVTNSALVIVNEKQLQYVISLYTISTIMPVAAYLGLMMIFRYHLFIYSVFAPKFFYEVYNVFVFYFIFALTNLYFKLFK
ncbi:GPI ethanolamine phosphate transferase 2 [Teleopsis dalmanni]|uniref:GPI ethanolamine phosphate transferase 2 n=1 Tax=Teleopsis dalmanni TaxID=139649 RepID=UPI0018CEEDE9|nr:GPI ethanolamine phosphate transferase 2 [Teleopsis dalmanni]